MKNQMKILKLMLACTILNFSFSWGAPKWEEAVLNNKIKEITYLTQCTINTDLIENYSDKTPEKFNLFIIYDKDIETGRKQNEEKFYTDENDSTYKAFQNVLVPFLAKIKLREGKFEKPETPSGKKVYLRLFSVNIQSNNTEEGRNKKLIDFFTKFGTSAKNNALYACGECAQAVCNFIKDEAFLKINFDTIVFINPTITAKDQDIINNIDQKETNFRIYNLYTKHESVQKVVGKAIEATTSFLTSYFFKKPAENEPTKSFIRKYNPILIKNKNGFYSPLKNIEVLYQSIGSESAFNDITLHAMKSDFLIKRLPGILETSDQYIINTDLMTFVPFDLTNNISIFVNRFVEKKENMLVQPMGSDEKDKVKLKIKITDELKDCFTIDFDLSNNSLHRIANFGVIKDWISTWVSTDFNRVKEAHTKIKADLLNIKQSDLPFTKKDKEKLNSYLKNDVIALRRISDGVTFIKNQFNELNKKNSEESIEEKDSFTQSLNNIINVIWYLFAIAIIKDQGYENGTFIIHHKQLAKIIYDYFIKHIKTYGSLDKNYMTNVTNLGGCYNLNPYGYPRIATHLEDTETPWYGIDIRTSYFGEALPILPNQQCHILFGKIKDGVIMIKPEGAGIYLRELFAHAMHLNTSLNKELGSDDEDKFRKERVPLKETEYFIEIVKENQDFFKPILGDDLTKFSSLDENNLKNLAKCSKGIGYMFINLNKAIHILNLKVEKFEELNKNERLLLEKCNKFTKMLAKYDYFPIRIGREVIISTPEIMFNSKIQKAYLKPLFNKKDGFFYSKEFNKYICKDCCPAESTINDISSEQFLKIGESNGVTQKSFQAFFSEIIKETINNSDGFRCNDISKKPSSSKKITKEEKKKIKEAYKALNLDEDADAEKIKLQYKKLAMKYHPDRNLDNKEEANEKFIKINDAYEFLIKTLEEQKKN